MFELRLLCPEDRVELVSDALDALVRGETTDAHADGRPGQIRLAFYDDAIVAAVRRVARRPLSAISIPNDAASIVM